MFPEGRLLDFVIVGAVALIVVGPKDLPLLMRKVGQFMARVRGMAAEITATICSSSVPEIGAKAASAWREVSL